MMDRRVLMLLLVVSPLCIYPVGCSDDGTVDSGGNVVNGTISVLGF